MSPRGDCPRCGQTNVQQTDRGSIKAHRCPHGGRCDPMPGKIEVPICGPCLEAKNQRAIAGAGAMRERFGKFIEGLSHDEVRTFREIFGGGRR